MYDVKRELKKASRQVSNYKAVDKMTKRLGKINLKSNAENTKNSIRIFIEAFIFGVIYFGFSYNQFHSLWYLKLLCVVSTLIFIYIYINIRVEVMEIKIKKKLPRIFRKVAHYMKSYDGNVLKALKATEQVIEDDTKMFITKIIKVLESENIETEIETIKKSIGSIWVSMLYELLGYAQKYGNSSETQENIIGKNISKLTEITNDVNIVQGYDNVTLVWIEIFVFFAAIICLPLTKHYYDTAWGTDYQGLYDALEAQIMTAQIILFCNISTVFIDWVRKNH